MKNFLTKALLFVLPLFLLLVTVNYFGDAANLFNREYEKEIAEILSSGMNVTNISNYDERLLQEEIIKNLEYTPDVVILGSSRAMLISEDYFPGLKVMNNAVSGASLEDLIAIYQIYKVNQKLPKKIILGIDPWTFQVDKNRTRWKSIGKYYHEFNQDESQENSKVWDQLISLSYFQESLFNLPNKLSGKNQPVSTNQLSNPQLTKLNDGSIIYGEKRRNISAIAVEESARSWISSGMIKRYENFKSLDPKWSEFEMFIEELNQQGIEIEFVLAPFYPLVYEEMISRFSIIREIENQTKNLAEKRGIVLNGSFDPDAVQLNESAFYNETHPKEMAVRKLFN